MNATPAAFPTHLRFSPASNPCCLASGAGHFAWPATTRLRTCQIEALTGLEQSFAEDRPRALIQIATGTGKTFAAQRLYSILHGEELPADLDERSTGHLSAAEGRPKGIASNEHVPIEAFDSTIADGCRRSIYNPWRQMLEYFDALLVGLTATPAKQTFR